MVVAMGQTWLWGRVSLVDVADCLRQRGVEASAQAPLIRDWSAPAVVRAMRLAELQVECGAHDGEEGVVARRAVEAASTNAAFDRDWGLDDGARRVAPARGRGRRGGRRSAPVVVSGHQGVVLQHFWARPCATQTVLAERTRAARVSASVNGRDHGMF